jgi:kynurenine formamidase
MSPRFVDLSHTIEDGLVTYPGLPAPTIDAHLTREASREKYAPGYEFHIGHVDMVGNTGTYLDVPFHRLPDGFDLAELPLELVAGVPGVLVDAVDEQEVGVERLEGLDLGGRAVLVRTGWSRHFGTQQYGDPSHPFLSEAAARFLVAAGVTLVGIDSVNIDGTADGMRPVHTVLLQHGVFPVEHLTNLDQVDEPGFEVFAVPPKIKGLGTFPVRAFVRWP